MFRSVRTRDRSSAPTLDIAPLIDVVFILLIFFLVTTTFVRDTGVNVNRPEATVTTSLESASLRVSITSAGDCYTEGSRISLEQLRSKISARVGRDKDLAVVVIPDADVPSGRLIEVMDTARLAGARDVVVATRSKGAKP